MFAQAERAGIAGVVTISPAIVAAHAAQAFVAEQWELGELHVYTLAVAMLVVGGTNTVVLSVDEQQPVWAWFAGPVFMALALGLGFGSWAGAGLVFACGVAQGQLQRPLVKLLPESLDGIVWRRPVLTFLACLLGLAVLALTVYVESERLKVFDGDQPSPDRGTIEALDYDR